MPLCGRSLEFLIDANNADFAVFTDGDILYNGTEYNNIDTGEDYVRVFADVSQNLSISTFSGWLTDARYYSNGEAYMFVLPNDKVCLIDLTSEHNTILLPDGCTELCLMTDSHMGNFYINSDANRLSEDKLISISIPPSITKFSLAGVCYFGTNSWFNFKLFMSKGSAYELVNNISDYLSSESKGNHKLKNQSKLEDYIEYLYETFNIAIELY